MTIGLVIPNTTSVSETFFKTFVNGLRNRNIQVILFPNKNPGSSKQQTVYTQNKIFDNRLLQVIVMALVLTKLLLLKNSVVRKYINLEANEGKAFTKILKSLYLNSHILGKSIDWLHFGFGTMVFGKENLAKTLGAKMSISFRGFDAFVYPVKNPGCYDKVWSKIDKVHVLSDSLKNKVHELSGTNDLSISIIEPAIDTPEKTTISDEVNNTIRILTVARLHWVKGLDNAIYAMKVLEDLNVDYTYDILGEGAEYEKLLFLIDDLDLSGKVRLLGEKSHSQTIKAFGEYDIYIQPSLSEGFCNAVLEAKSHGLLCIVTKAGGMTENVKDGLTGWTVSKYDSVALANKIYEVSNLDRTESKRYRKNSIKSAKENSLNDHIEAWLNFYS